MAEKPGTWGDMYVEIPSETSVSSVMIISNEEEEEEDGDDDDDDGTSGSNFVAGAAAGGAGGCNDGRSSSIDDEGGTAVTAAAAAADIFSVESGSADFSVNAMFSAKTFVSSPLLSMLMMKMVLIEDMLISLFACS